MALFKLLCVDDEPAVLQGLSLHLRRNFQVLMATSGDEGLEVVRNNPDIAVVVSDMRMPKMNGSEFLARVREVAPDAVRILLTGQADLESAIDAVNRGQIFRFLTKPCPPQVLLSATKDAAELHRLMIAERELLEKTLQGAVQAMLEVLSLASPMAFGRALRMRQLAEELLAQTGQKLDWEIAVGLMLSLLGYITLPEDTLTRLHKGAELSPAEKDMVNRLPQVADKLLSHIPRIDGVREIVRHQQRRFDGNLEPADAPRGQNLPLGARLAKLLFDYDQLESQGLSPQEALGMLRARLGVYDPQLIEALDSLKGKGERTRELLELPLGMIKPGMVFVNDVYMPGGLLLVARGTAASVGMIERIRNMPTEAREQKVAVSIG